MIAKNNSGPKEKKAKEVISFLKKMSSTELKLNVYLKPNSSLMISPRLTTPLTCSCGSMNSNGIPLKINFPLLLHKSKPSPKLRTT